MRDDRTLQPNARLLLPFAAYRRDRTRAARDEPFCPHDGIWLVIASFLDNLGVLPPEARAEVLLGHEEALRQAVGGEEVELAPDDPFLWAARLHAALTPNPVKANHDVVVGTVREMAAQMREVGAFDLAQVTLEAAQRAFPNTGPRTNVAVLIEQARIARAHDDPVLARQLLSQARREAKAASSARLSSKLIADCDRAWISILSRPEPVPPAKPRRRSTSPSASPPKGRAKPKRR